MFDAPYQYSKAAVKTDPSDKHIVSKTIYRFKAARRHYLVYLHLYPNNLFAIKFCDRHFKEDKSAFSHIYNDYDGFRVISTCLYILREFLSKNKSCSFGYFAVPRKEGDYKVAVEATLKKRTKKKGFSKARYNIYQYMMVNKFAPDQFVQYYDAKNNICILVNKRTYPTNEKRVSYVKETGLFMLTHFDILFEPDEVSG
jgi:hypothetical protein